MAHTRDHGDRVDLMDIVTWSFAVLLITINLAIIGGLFYMIFWLCTAL